MSDLIYKLKLLYANAHGSDAATIKAAIERIIELEEKLADYEDDITDWQSSIETQMRRRKEDQ